MSLEHPAGFEPDALTLPAFNTYLQKLGVVRDPATGALSGSEEAVKSAGVTIQTVHELLSLDYDRGSVPALDDLNQIKKMNVRWMIRADMQKVLALQVPEHVDPLTEEELTAEMEKRDTIGMVVELNEANRIDYTVIGSMVYQMKAKALHLLHLQSVEGPLGKKAREAALARLMDKLSADKRTALINDVLSPFPSLQHVSGLLRKCVKEIDPTALKALEKFVRSVSRTDPYVTEIRLLAEKFLADPQPGTAVVIHGILSSVGSLYSQSRDSSSAHAHDLSAPVVREARKDEYAHLRALTGSRVSPKTVSSVEYRDFLVAEREGMVAGVASYVQNPTLESTLSVDVFAVAPEHRNTGVAHALVTQILATMRRVEALHLQTREDSALTNNLPLHKLLRILSPHQSLINMDAANRVLSGVTHQGLREELALLVSRQMPRLASSKNKKAQDAAFRALESLKTVIGLADAAEVSLTASIFDPRLNDQIKQDFSYSTLSPELADMYDDFTAGRKELEVPKEARREHSWSVASMGDLPVAVLEWKDDAETRQRRLYRFRMLNRDQTTDCDEAFVLSNLLYANLKELSRKKQAWSLTRFEPESVEPAHS